METLITGLSGAEAKRRLGQFGPNATPDVAVHPLRLILAKFLAPVSVLLEIAIVLQLALGEYVEGAIIGVLLVFNSAIGFFHENRAQSTIAALKSGLALKASVLRDGVWTILPAAELVPGDIVKLSLGTVVAADVRIREGSILLDQSMLTGESLPVEAGRGTETYAGALVQRGEAIAEVLATGVRTKFGRTAELVRTAYVVSTQQKAVFRVVRNLAGFNGAVTVLLMVYAYHIGMPLAEAIPLVLISVLASVPVALPATFTLATAIGAQALTRVGVLPTRLSAVDEAASLDVLCIDKTGTLTRNELAVAAIHAMPGFDEAHVLALAALASAEGGRDPVDAAVRAAAACAANELASKRHRPSHRHQLHAVRSGHQDVGSARARSAMVTRFASSKAPSRWCLGFRNPRRPRSRPPMNWKSMAIGFSASRSGPKLPCASSDSWHSAIRRAAIQGR